jgi:hypothetical protein
MREGRSGVGLQDPRALCIYVCMIYLEGPCEKVAQALACKTLALSHRPFDLEDKVAKARLEGARFRQPRPGEFVDALELVLHRLYRKDHRINKRVRAGEPPAEHRACQYLYFCTTSKASNLGFGKYLVRPRSTERASAHEEIHTCNSRATARASSAFTLRSRKQLLNRPSSSSSIHSCFAPTAAHSRRQHMCAHVSIRQHMSAYVSIRQHTSAYLLRSNGSTQLVQPRGVGLPRSSSGVSIFVLLY